MKRNTRFNYIILVYLAGIVLFTLFRLVETLVYCSAASFPEDMGNLYWHALWKGFRFDTAVSAYILTIPLLMMIVGELVRIRQKWYYAIAHCLTMTLYTVAFFACAADIPYFCYFFQRLDAQVLTMDSSLPVVIDMIFSEPTYLLYFFVFLVVSVGWWLLGRLIYKRSVGSGQWTVDSGQWIVGISMSALLLLGWFTSIRGHLTDKPPLRAEHAVFCNNPFLNQIGLNPVFTFLKSAGTIINDHNHPIELIDPETAFHEYSSQEILPSNDSSIHNLPQGTNVVLVIMESMAIEKTSLSMLTPHPSPLTPNLDSLMRNGITFTQTWSAGTQTFNGVYSTLYSHPAIFKRHTMHGSATMPRLCGLPHALRAAGYSTAFFMAHQGYFDGMESFLYSNGFDHVFEQNNYPEEEWINSYGIPDHILFRHALEYINTASQKGAFFTSILTISDHPPYVMPKGIGLKPRSIELTDQIVEYADWSIGQFMAEASKQPWFDNTLFVFVADHGCPDKNPLYDIPLTRNLIPFILYAPSRLDPEFIDRIALQIDVAPTVLSLLGLGGEGKMMGIDVLRGQRKYAFFGSGEMIGAVDGELLYIYRHGEGRTTLHRYKERDPQDISGQYPERKEALGRHALSMIQMSYQMLKNGTTSCDK